MSESERMSADVKERLREVPKQLLLSDMPCPDCGKRCSKVVDTRGTLSGAIRRRRECLCGRRFTTWEQLEKEQRSISSRLNRIESMLEDLRYAVESSCL